MMDELTLAKIPTIALDQNIRIQVHDKIRISEENFVYFLNDFHSISNYTNFT